MCSLVVSILDSPAVDPRSNPGSALLMSEKSQAVYYISSCHIDGRQPKTRISIFAIVQATKKTNLFCNVTLHCA